MRIALAIPALLCAGCFETAPGSENATDAATAASTDETSGDTSGRTGGTGGASTSSGEDGATSSGATQASSEGSGEDDSSGSDSSGTGGDANGAFDFGSGSRLRAQAMVTETGTRRFRRWWDTDLETDCYFEATADGERCVPLGLSADNHYFADAGCTQRLFDPWAAVCAETPNYGRVYGDYDACTDTRPVTVHEPGAAHTGAIYVRDPESGGCMEDVRSEGDYFLVGPALENTGFVSASVEVESGVAVSGAAPARRVASDGAWRRIHIVDAASGERMRDVHLTDGKRHFVPDGGFIGFAGDATCNELVASAAKCATPTHAADLLPQSGCDPQEFNVHAVEGPHSGDLYERQGGACPMTNASDWTNQSFHALNETPSDPTEFPEITVTNGSVAGDPLQLDALGVGGEAWLPAIGGPEEWNDANHGSHPCGFLHDRDGQLRCVPSWRGWQLIYLDDQCTQSAARGAFHTSAHACHPDTVPSHVSFFRPRVNQCDTTSVDIFELGAPIPAAVYYVDRGTSCTMSGMSDGLFALGQEVDPAEFSTGEVQIE